MGDLGDWDPALFSKFLILQAVLFHPLSGTHCQLSSCDPESTNSP